LLIILLSSTLIFSAKIVHASPSDAAARNIRVAQIDLSNFYDYDRNGPIGGYGFDYLEEISNYTGWRYEYVPVSWERGLEMLNAGEIDLLAPAPMTPDLHSRFEYSDREVGLNYSVLCVAVENTKTAFNDFNAINGMKVGVLKNALINPSLEAYEKSNGFRVETVPYDNQAALLKALHDGKVGAILTSSLEKRPTERIIAKFAPTPYYFIAAKGNMDIMSPLNAALASIKENNPYFDYELQKKYYNWNEYSVPVFTQEEKEFIKNAAPLKTVYDPEWAPIEYYNGESGEFAGINADIFKLISDVSGLKFSYIKTPSYTEALKMITNGDVDVLTGIDSDAHWANQHNLMQTDTFLSASIVLVKNVNAKNIETATAALAKDYLAATEYVKTSSPDAKVVYYDSPLECFEAVNRGDADVTYANSYVAERLLENPKLNRLAIVETVNLSDNLSIGISDTADPLLLSILNKSIHSITDTQLNRIIFKHTISEKPEINLEYLLYRNPGYLLTALIVLFLITVIIMALIIITKNMHNADIKKVAYHDSVTGGWNFNKFKVDAQALLKNPKNREYAIVYLDIYKFSYINDTFGYSAGDAILAEVAGELERCMKDAECCARLSADNFVCLVEYESDEAMLRRGLDFQKSCEARLDQINCRFRIQFTSSIYKVERGETNVPSLVGKADIAHKTIGNIRTGSIVFYNDWIQNDFLRKKKLESAMWLSLKQGDFIVHLQPKIDLETGNIVGTEALARWQHPTEGLILPNEFIPLFESNGFILELDFYVYDIVCRLIRRWIDAGENVMPVSVNVSKAHLANRQFGTQLNALLEKYNIAPELLELELTESVLMDDAEEAAAMIRDLKDLGFFILIDDFGSGYSSLNQLKDLTVDVLKLDKEFFRKGGMAEKDKIIVDGIIRIANDLNLKILSEGVETQEQVDFLMTAGCRLVQGYFFARPMPVTDFEKLAGYSSPAVE
jgi:diguanylate cyclase (GGDEF)-like protein